MLLMLVAKLNWDHILLAVYGCYLNIVYIALAISKEEFGTFYDALIVYTLLAKTNLPCIFVHALVKSRLINCPIIVLSKKLTVMHFKLLATDISWFYVGLYLFYCRVYHNLQVLLLCLVYIIILLTWWRCLISIYLIDYIFMFLWTMLENCCYVSLDSFNSTPLDS